MRKAKLENEPALQKEPNRETQGRAQPRLKIFGFAFVFAVVDSCATRFFNHRKRVNQGSSLCNFRCKQVRTPSVLQEEPERKHKSQKCFLLHLSLACSSMMLAQAWGRLMLQQPSKNVKSAAACYYISASQRIQLQCCCLLPSCIY